MRMTKFKLWRAAGAALVLGLAACGGEGGENGGERGQAGASGEGGEAGEAASPPAPEAASAGGEAGEAGAATAYAGVDGAQLTAMRLQHLKGFVLVAQQVAASGASEEAEVLVQQGLLEVYDPATAAFGGFNVAPVRAAGADAAALAAAAQAIDAARAPLTYDHAALTARMVDIATGLYQGMNQADFVDPIEYQHSLGAALAARDALVSGRTALEHSNARAYREAVAELDRFIALWPAVSAPEHPASYAQVLAQGSRVRFALSPYL